MKTNQIFRWIWRVNAVLLLLGGVGLLGLTALLLADYFQSHYRTRNTDTVRLETRPNSTLEEHLQYGNFNKIEGSDYIVWTINSKQDYAVPVSFGQSGINLKEQTNLATRNFLFLNTSDGSTYKLLPTNEFLILSSESITKENKKSEEKLPVGYFLYEVIKSDSDNDGKLTGKDTKTISLSDASGKNLTEVIDNVESVIGKERINDDVLMVSYLIKDKPHVSLIKLSEYKIISTKELPNI